MRRRTGVDSAYSWLVAGSSFFVFLMMYGAYRLSGVMFVASMPRYGVGREAASFPYTFAGFTKNVAGPVVGILLQKFSIRKLIFSGCVLAAIGIGTCFFAENIVTVTILWGFVFGSGMALSCSLLPVLVNDYFLEHRATAAGIAFSGMCVGSMIFPPLVEICIEYYGISGTFLIISGLILNCIPLALFLRQRSLKQTTTEKDRTVPNLLKVKSIPIDSECSSLLTSKDHLRKNVVYYNSFSERSQNDSHSNREFASEKQQLSQNGNSMHSEDLQKSNNHLECEFKNNKSGCYTNKDSNHLNRSYSADFREPNEPYTPRHPPMDPEYPTNIAETKDLQSGVTTKQYSENESDKGSQSACSGNCSLMLNSVYLLVLFTKTLSNSISLCINTIAFDYARDIGISMEYEKYILIFSSMGELLGRLCLGRIADTHCVSKAMFMVFCSIAQGLGALGIAWSNGFYVLGVSLFFYSFMGSVVQFMCPLIIADGIEEDLQAFAITSSSVLAGPASLAISPLIGYLRDEIGTYIYLFYGISILSVLTGFIWLLGYFLIKPRLSYTEIK